MWNVFRFFWYWAWLTIGSIVVWLVLAALTAPGGGHASVSPGGPSGFLVATIAGLITGVFMCVPAYYFARPKRGLQHGL